MAAPAKQEVSPVAPQTTQVVQLAALHDMLGANSLEMYTDDK